MSIIYVNEYQVYTRICVYLYIHIYIYLFICTNGIHIVYMFPKPALANGVLTVLCKGPCLLGRQVARAARNSCL